VPTQRKNPQNQRNNKKSQKKLPEIQFRVSYHVLYLDNQTLKTKFTFFEI